MGAICRTAIYNDAQLQHKGVMSKLDYTVRRFYVDQFFHQIISQTEKTHSVLDLGGHKIGKRGHFDISAYGLQPVYINLTPQKQPDILAAAEFIPHPSNCFDIVICAELFEHVRNPVTILEEVFRVLRPNGQILITTPFLFHIHGDPYDYGRYTDHYWESVLAEVGFAVERIERQGFFYAVLLDFIKQYCRRILRGPLYWSGGWIFALLQKLLLLVERSPRVRTNAFLTSYTTGFGIVGVKP